MKARRFGIALLLVTAVLGPVAPAPAVAAPADGRQFKQGYQDGFDRGMAAARTDCAKPIRAQTYEATDFQAGAEEYCP
jgi:hypothetical protein